LNGPFGIQTGVAISFMVKRAKAKGSRVRYANRPQLETAEEKLSFLGNTELREIEMINIRPNARHDWVNQAATDFDTLIPIADKATKSIKVGGQERAIFKTFSFGVVTNRDEWVYSEEAKDLEIKVRYLILTYNDDCRRLQAVRDPKQRSELLGKSIKWTRAVKADLAAGIEYIFDAAVEPSILSAVC
jgi:predicted helicase